MDAKGTNKILAMILEIYPSFGKDRNPELTSKLWQRLFEDEPYEWVEKALLAFFATDTKGFPPTPGNIKMMIQELIDAKEPTEMDAWALVAKATKRGLYNAKEEFDKLPREIQEIVGSPEMIHDWAMMDSDEFHTVVASNFQRSYRARSESRKVNGLLPSSLRINIPKNEVKKLEERAPALEEPRDEPYEYCDIPQSFRDVANKIFKGV